MKLYKYTEEQLKDAIKNSFSIRESLNKLGIASEGGNFRTFKKAVNYFKIDTSHFTGQGHKKGKTFQPKRDIQVYLNNEFKTTSHQLRLRLIKEGYFKYECSSCKNIQWMNNPIPLELDHIDGNHYNNNLNNLRLLCPNCHALTPTYKGKNIK